MASTLPEGVTLVDHPLVHVKLARLREQSTPSTDFRRKLSELASLLMFEATRDLATLPTEVQTPLALCAGKRLARPVILAPILRAGLGMIEGMSHVLSDVSIGHIGMFRNETTLRPESYYFKLPAHLADADVIVADPMLATGWSASSAITQLKEKGATAIRFVCIVTCPEGLAQLRGTHPDVPIFTAAIDPGLDERGYILPGLGDAGDRYFGTFSETTL